MGQALGPGLVLGLELVVELVLELGLELGLELVLELGPRREVLQGQKAVGTGLIQCHCLHRLRHLYVSTSH
jgi:hypothetical protein